MKQSHTAYLMMEPASQLRHVARASSEGQGSGTPRKVQLSALHKTQLPTVPFRRFRRLALGDGRLEVRSAWEA